MLFVSTYCFESWCVGVLPAQAQAVYHYTDRSFAVLARLLQSQAKHALSDAPSTTKTPTMTTNKQRRKPPTNSLLDQATLIESLEDAGLYGKVIKPIHIEAFYQSLHRQHYPEPAAFVETYHRYEQGLRTEEATTSKSSSRPLNNAITKVKNVNKMQLPRAFLEFLSTCSLQTITSRVADVRRSKDQSTTKLVVELYDGQRVESVLMRYEKNHRASLCVSSQVGCAMKCTFCATGMMGLTGNLNAGEILEQVVHTSRILADEFAASEKKEHDLVNNIVFMGMGEPLDNYKNVVEACRSLINRKRWNLAHGRVTVSTVGIVSKIRRLTQELPEVSLALSLHAPNQELRQSIVPTARQYPIQDLVDALDAHMNVYTKRSRLSARRRAMIEYVMIEGPTTTLEAAHQLGQLCEGRNVVVNLIPYNSTESAPLQCPSKLHMRAFRDIVKSYGVFTTVRRTMGADIDSACGQLIQKQQMKEVASPSPDIEDAASAHPKETQREKPDDEKDTDELPAGLGDWMEPLAVATVFSGLIFIAVTSRYIIRRRS